MPHRQKRRRKKSQGAVSVNKLNAVPGTWYQAGVSGTVVEIYPAPYDKGMTYLLHNFTFAQTSSKFKCLIRNVL
jgi:hypothetical protein